MSASSPHLPGMPPSDYARRVLDEIKTRCVFLKTKEAFLGLPSHGREEGRYDTTIWWCERTCEPLGPAACGQAGRACYEAPRRPRP
jgi:hypothetical protein